MICPYIQNFSYTVQKNHLNEEIDYTDKITIGTISSNIQCLEKECAVWDRKERRCRYNG
jgi:hypothetical protein